jgi:hypothetical protein
MPVQIAADTQKPIWTCAGCDARDVIVGVCLFIESCNSPAPSATSERGIKHVESDRAALSHR